MAEAHDGTEIPEDTIDIPASLRGRFSADSILSAMNVLGLNENDLQDERWQVILEQRLEEEEAAANPDEDDEPNPETEESEEEKKDDEQKPEVKDEAKKPPVHVDLAPEDVKKYVDKTWERSQQVNSPQMTKLFTDSLATALGTPPEQRELLDNVVGLLNYGGVSLVQSAVPALVTEYMQQNIMDIMQQVLPHAMEGYAPGFQKSYSDQMLTGVWDSVRGDLPEFGSAEFQELAKTVHEKHPFLNDIDFKDAKGQPLPLMDALRAKAELTARLCRGERVTPATIQQAVERSKAEAAKSTRRVTAKGSLGKGRTASASFKQQESTTSLRDAYTAQHDGVV